MKVNTRIVPMEQRGPIVAFNDLYGFSNDSFDKSAALKTMSNEDYSKYLKELKDFSKKFANLLKADLSEDAVNKVLDRAASSLNWANPLLDFIKEEA